MDWEKYSKNAEELLREQNWIPIWTNFCPELTEAIVPLIFKAKQLGKTEIRLLIDSNGGHLTSVTAISNAIRLTGLPSVGLVLSKALSGGFFTLQYCDKRLAVNGAFLCPHWGQTGLNNNEISAIRAARNKKTSYPVETILSYTDALMKQTNDRCGLKIQELEEIFSQDRNFTAQQSLELKFIDQILFNPDPNLKELAILSGTSDTA